jgi:hypothetical protein
MFDEREIVSPATPPVPEDRATPVVLSGGALGVADVPGTGRVVSYARSSPVALHALSSAIAAALANSRYVIELP